MSIQSRKEARHISYKLIYEALYNGYKINDLSYKTLVHKDIINSDENYIRTVTFGACSKHNDLIGYIEKYAKGYSFDRIYKTDLAALLMAMYEMKFMKDIPKNVAIAEAIELVKIYSTDKSYSFVNGILSSFFKELADIS